MKPSSSLPIRQTVMCNFPECFALMRDIAPHILVSGQAVFDIFTSSMFIHKDLGMGFKCRTLFIQQNFPFKAVQGLFYHYKFIVWFPAVRLSVRLSQGYIHTHTNAHAHTRALARTHTYGWLMSGVKITSADAQHYNCNYFVTCAEYILVH